MKRSMLFAALSTTALVTTLALPAQSGSAVDAAGTTTQQESTATAEAVTWNKVFGDEFSGTALDNRKWTVYTGGQRRASNVTVRDGHVNLTTRRTSQGWTAAGMTSSKALKTRYGKFEIRARFDRGQGVRAVALLWPTGGVWPPEIDFLEISGNDPLRQKNLTANHYVSNGQHKIQHALVESDYTQWHRVGVIWEPDKLTYLLDGRAVATVSGHSPARDMWLGLQTATGTGPGAPTSSTPSAVDFEVDWVRIYKRG